MTEEVFLGRTLGRARRLNNVEEWSSIAERGHENAKWTTQVADHDPGHDDILGRFAELLDTPDAEAPATSTPGHGK